MHPDQLNRRHDQDGEGRGGSPAPGPQAVSRGPRLRGLLAVNAALLLVMAAVTFAPSAGAQAGRARGEYLMVSGYINGSEPQVVYIVDATNQQMVAVRYRQDLRVLEGLSARNLRADSAEIAAGQFRAGGDASRRGNTR